MSRRKSNLTEVKQNIIAAILDEYDVKSAKSIQETLKDLLD